MKNKNISSCIAIEDGAALHYKDNKLVSAISFYEGKNAYNVSISKGKIIEDKIKKKNLY